MTAIRAGTREQCPAGGDLKRDKKHTARAARQDRDLCDPRRQPSEDFSAHTVQGLVLGAPTSARITDPAADAR